MADDELAWETIDSDVAYECPGFEIVHEDVRLPDGTETDFDYLSEPPAVVVVPFLGAGGRDDDVVVIEEWRQAVDRVVRGFPVGTIEPDEAPPAAARRELREETGYEAGSVETLCVVDALPGVADSELHYFVARDCSPAGGQDLQRDETIRTDTAAFAAVHEDAVAGRLRDGRAMLGALRYAAERD